VLRDETSLEAGCLGDGGERAARGGPGDPLADGEAVSEAAGGIGGGQGGLDVKDAVDAVGAAARVAAGGADVQDGAHVPVRDREGDQPAGRRATCQARVRRNRDMPTAPQGSPGMTWSGLVPGSLAVGPGDEVLDPQVQGLVLQGAGVAAVVDPEGVMRGAEEEFPGGDDVLQDTDGADDGGGRDPGDLAVLAGGDVVPVGVGDVLVVPAADQVTPGGAARTRVWAAP
jgi:hypothetical protein